MWFGQKHFFINVKYRLITHDFDHIGKVDDKITYIVRMWANMCANLFGTDTAGSKGAIRGGSRRVELVCGKPKPKLGTHQTEYSINVLTASSRQQKHVIPDTALLAEWA